MLNLVTNTVWYLQEKAPRHFLLSILFIRLFCVLGNISEKKTVNPGELNFRRHFILTFHGRMWLNEHLPLTNAEVTRCCTLLNVLKNKRNSENSNFGESHFSSHHVAVLAATSLKSRTLRHQT